MRTHLALQNYCFFRNIQNILYFLPINLAKPIFFSNFAPKFVFCALCAHAESNEEYRFAIEYYIFREGDNLIAYCPSLDISTSGKDYSDAVKNFYERFQIYVETSLELGTLWDDLREHGWKVTERKLTPPSFSRLIRKPEVSRLLGGHINYEKVSAPMRIATMA